MARQPMAALARTAGVQHGLFTRAQALAAGVTSKRLTAGVRDGRWERAHRGVYRVAGAPAGALPDLMAAVLAAGPGAVASHRAAAWLWGLVDDPATEVTAPAHRSPLGVAAHRRAGAGRPVVRRGVPCTDPLSTVVDLAALGDRALVEQALDRGIAARLFTVAAVASHLERRAGRGRRGVALVRRCLDRRLGGERRRPSVLESRMARLVAAAGLPAPVRELPLPALGCRIDFAWPRARLAVEVDGYADHSSWDDFGADRRRQNGLVLAGWTVLRFTWDDVVRRPAAVAAALRRGLSASRPA